jgi:hypothetical protein
MNRRTFLQAGILSPLGLGLDHALWLRSTAQAASSSGKKATACILLYMTGGASQLETFDMKPDAPPETRGEFRPIATNVAGIQICEHLPMLARLADRYAILRSVWHNSNRHGAGAHNNLTGHSYKVFSGAEPQVDRRDPPCIGAVVRQLRGDRNGLPAAVQLPRPIGDGITPMWAGQHAGLLGPKYDPLFLFDEKWNPGEPLPGFTAPVDVDTARQTARLDLLKTIQARRPSAAPAERNFERFQQLAFDVLRSGAAWKAFRLDDEPLQSLERYGDNRFGRSCLVARRLVEAGVGLVTVPWTCKDNENFDTHSRIFPKMKDKLLPPVDRAFSALIEDLEQRGLLEQTLVSWTGDFGRDPKLTAAFSQAPGDGRAHWGRVYSTVLAGGGVRGGRVVGRSDKQGGAPADKPVHVSDFVATMYHALGYGTDTCVTDQTGRPFFVVQGKPVLELF